MIIKWFAATTQKSCNLPAENEDAFGPVLENGSMTPCQNFRCILSDGATRSSFSGPFARSLVTGLLNTKVTINDLNPSISDARIAWEEQINQIDLPWHAQEKIKDGAYATVLLFQLVSDHLSGNTGKKWSAIAIGDTCLFHFRREQLLEKLPLHHSNEFNNHPPLVSSHKLRKYYFPDWEYSGEWFPGDDFILATDALAKWIYYRLESGNSPLAILKDKLSRKSRENNFSVWIELMRKKREIRDDDCTLIWIKTQ